MEDLLDGTTVYVIRACNPLDMEGSPDAIAVFADKETADEKVVEWNDESETSARADYGDRWSSFAIEFSVQPMPLITRYTEAPDSASF